MADFDYPFKAEYAKSGRASCKACKDTIDKSDLRLAIMIQSPHFDGKQPNWHHFTCFWQRARMLTSTDEIHGFDSLRWEDQEKITNKIGVKSGGGNKFGSKAKAAESRETLDFEAEYAKSGGSMCRACDNKIPKLDVRLSYKDYTSAAAAKYGPVSMWHHIDCFVEKRDSFGFIKDMQPELIKGFKFLRKETKLDILGKLGKGSKKRPAASPATNGEANGSDAKKAKVEDSDAAALKEQSQLLWKYRDLLEQYVSTDAMRCLLEYNGQELLKGKSEEQLLTRVSDCMVFGALKPCDDCKGQLLCGSTGYHCQGNMSEWTKCTVSTLEPKRKKFHVPEEYNDVDFLAKYKYVKRKKVFSSAAKTVSESKSLQRSSSQSSEEGKHSTKSAMRKQLDASAEAAFTKSMPAKLKMKLKGGAAVDPDSELDDSAHVLEEHGNIHNAVLGLVDIARGTNSYYKLQILESDSGKRCWVFRSWGRVGTTIGGNKLEPFSKAEALKQFKFLYLDKTGNQWDDRKDFKKQPNKFYPLDIDYGADDVNLANVKMEVDNSKLSKPVQDLVKMVFDVESMKKAMLEFEIDLKKMPLGKLSKKQIEQAYKVLSELNQIIDTGGSSNMILDGSNRFYTLIPHDFGLQKPKMLDTLEVIKAKTDMLDSLLDIEIAYSMLKSGDKGEDNTIDRYYKKLNTDFQVVDQKSEEFEQLKTCVVNTHAKTHTQYDLELLEVFKLDRAGEKARFKPFKQLHNHKMLWHGSRVTNFAGILSQGLRIAPPEAPVTGYMFGKGIYFADMVSKSANYCNVNKSNPYGLLLLCDVALGNMHELTGAEYIEKLPKGKHSTKGLGMTGPDPADAVMLADNVELPSGEGVSTNSGGSSLLYNEYIVYDTAQVKIQYMLKCKFNYKSLW